MLGLAQEEKKKKIQGENKEPWNMARTGFQFQIDSFG